MSMSPSTSNNSDFRTTPNSVPLRTNQTAPILFNSLNNFSQMGEHACREPTAVPKLHFGMVTNGFKISNLVSTYEPEADGLSNCLEFRTTDVSRIL